MELTRIINPNTHDFYMVDVESTGLSTWKNYMTSLCVVKFDPFMGDVLDKFHIRFKKALTGRFGDGETLKWREENNVDEMESGLRTLMPYEAMEELQSFMGGHTRGKTSVIFANHTEFDISFIKGYYEALGLAPPWAYNKVFELNSILVGRGIHDKGGLIKDLLESDRWKDVLSLHFEEKEQKHNAFYDCVFQIELLMAAFRAGK